MRLAETVVQGERAAVAAGFPRQSVLNATEKAMWELFSRSSSTAEMQSAALKQVASESLSPVAREAVARMQAELALDRRTLH